MIDHVSGRRWGDVRCCEIPPQIAIDEGDCIDGGFVVALSSTEWLFLSGQTALSPKEYATINLRIGAKGVEGVVSIPRV
jgi:hypothetical protein